MAKGNREVPDCVNGLFHNTTLPKNSARAYQPKDSQESHVFTRLKDSLLLYGSPRHCGISHFRILHVTCCLVANQQLYLEENNNTCVHVWKLQKNVSTHFRLRNSSPQGYLLCKYSTFKLRVNISGAKTDPWLLATELPICLEQNKRGVHTGRSETRLCLHPHTKNKFKTLHSLRQKLK